MTTPMQNVALFEADLTNTIHLLASPDGIPTQDKSLYLEFLHKNIQALISNNLSNVHPKLLNWGIEVQGLSYLQLTGVLSNLYLRFTKELVDKEMSTTEVINNDNKH